MATFGCIEVFHHANPFYHMKTTMSKIFTFQMYFKCCSLILSRVNQVKKQNKQPLKKFKFPNVHTACKQTVPESLVVMINLLHNLWQYKQTTEYIRSRAQLWLAKELI